MQRRSAQTGKAAGASPATRTKFKVLLVVVLVVVLELLPSITRTRRRTRTIENGMSTGQARRASVLTSACLRASGASPRHSASLCRRPYTPHRTRSVPGSGALPDARTILNYLILRPHSSKHRAGVSY